MTEKLNCEEATSTRAWFSIFESGDEWGLESLTGCDRPFHETSRPRSD